MSLLSFFQKKEALISLDIGSSGIKLIELDIRSSKPKLVNVALIPSAGDYFSNNTVSKTELVAEQIGKLIEGNAVGNKRVVTAVPAPSVFTKKVKIQKMDAKEVSSYIQLEASNLIPHDIDAVKLDYHIISETSDGQLEVLVVAVKNEIIDSYMDCITQCGLETAVVDVDYFALQNVFEMNYPELEEQTVALINIGARYSSINIVRGHESLFTGDMPVGGKLITEALVEELGITTEEAEQLKRKVGEDKPEFAAAAEIVKRNLDYIASEYNRQLSFFWSASGSEGSIGRIFISGGASLTPGLAAEISAKTSIECEVLDPFRAVECGEAFDADYLKEVAPFVAIGVGMGIRQAGDRVDTV